MTFTNNTQHIQQHPASVDAYIRHGWSLVPIPPGTKGPRTTGWNKKESAIKSQLELPYGFGIGLAHAYSGTMAFDIDDWKLTNDAGIDLEALYKAPDAVIINSGRLGRGKLLYAMPDPLPSKKVIIDGVIAYELRCATASGLTVQDVLPPSIHPETRLPYMWGGTGHWTRLPTIPDSLLEHWENLLKADEKTIINRGDYTQSSWDDIRKALSFIKPDCSRESWIQVGMALHHAGTQSDALDDAFFLWDDWSQGSVTKYPGQSELFTQWKSFKSDKSSIVKLGTLFHLAKNAGWVRPLPDASNLFSSIDIGTPDDLIADLTSPHPEINFENVPHVLARRASEIGETVGCDPMVPLFAGLAAACAVADARHRLELIKDFKVPPVLWLMTIGKPADKKTPGSAPMFEPLRVIEAEDKPRYKKALLEWEGMEAAYASAKKAFLEFAASPEAMLGGQPPHVPEMPPMPYPLRLTVDDVTSQKLVRLAADRPQGLLCALDEMSNWVRTMVDKNSGENRSAWVKAYESRPYELDRVGTGSTVCENFAVAIYGNIQPKVYRDNIGALSADGLLQRFIPSVLDSRKTKIPSEIPDYLQNKQQWEMTLRTIFALPPTDYRLSADAKRAFVDFQHWYDAKRTDENLLQSDDSFMTAFGKIEGLAGRIMLVFHLMESPFSQEVSESLALKVIDLMKTYVIPALRYAYSELTGTATFDAWVREYIIQYADAETITMSEIKRAARRQLDRVNNWAQEDAIVTAAYPLEQRGWLIRIDERSDERRHKLEWMINPELKTMFKDYRKSVLAAKQRQLDDIYKLSASYKPKIKNHAVLDDDE